MVYSMISSSVILRIFFVCEFCVSTPVCFLVPFPWLFFFCLPAQNLYLCLRDATSVNILERATVFRSVAWQPCFCQLYKALIGRRLTPELLCANIADESCFFVN